MKPIEMNANNDATSSSKATIDQNNIPIEDLLGSVTTYNNVEGSETKSQQLRTSARVFKKMKMDSTQSVLTASEKKESTKEEPKQETKQRTLRPTWSQEDKSLFFEALNEFGKDFEAIHSQISIKLKKKGLPDSVIKTKDQVRHFYYRTWHKISKHLKFSHDIKKLAQELYGLINYGELRKKIGSVSEKSCMKLNQLIYRGYVSVRIKGKTMRIKTPMCRALRRLNKLDEKHDDLKLPMRINVELIPKDMNAWVKVQAVSQNPRVRASLPLHKRLNTLLRFLSCKWQTLDAAAYKNIVTTSHPAVLECIPDKKNIDETSAILDPLLRLSPQPDTHVERATFNLSEYLTSNSICLNAFEQRIGVKSRGELLWVTKGARKGGTKRARNESTGDKTSPSSKPTTSNNIDNNENCIDDIDCINEDAINTILMLQSHLDDGTDEDIKDKTDICDEIISEEMKDKSINTIRQGWNVSNCGNLSIGELYLMLGSNSQLILEYSWDETEGMPTTEVESCDKNETKTCETRDEDKNIEEVVSGSLQRLLSVAKLHYQKDASSHCTCGHVCGTGTKSNIQNKVVVKSNKVEIQEKPSVNDTMVEATTNTTVTSVIPFIIQSPIIEYTSIENFRTPLTHGIDSLRAQLDRLKPRYCNRRGRRPRSKQVFVERRLPLLPNRIENGHQILQMNIISSEDRGNTLRTMAPTILNIDKTEHNIAVEPGSSTTISINETENTPITFGSLTINQSSSATTTTSTEVGITNVIDVGDNSSAPSRVSSPTSISNLLEMAIATQAAVGLENKDSIQSFAGLLSSPTPPSSPSHILKENENQWLNSEVADFSLSSFLGHLESPVKPLMANAGSEDNHLSQDVDVQLQSLLTESSIDYVSKFADLAAQVNSEAKQ